MRFRLGYDVRENRDFESMKRYRLLVVPVAEAMAEKDQQALLDLAKAGVTLILCGVLPRFDDRFRPCTVLSNGLRIKTTVDHEIATVTTKHGSFPAYLYASIRSTDDGKVKKLATVGAKVVGVCCSRFKGSVYVVSFDMASGGDRRKLAFLESILDAEKIAAPFDSSDPSVHLAFQKGEKKGMLFVVVPPPGELSDALESGRKQIIIQADLKALGFAAANLKLTDIMLGEGAEPIKTTAADLKDGLPLEVEYPDGRVFLVERR
jgi:hypothetical protein